MLLFGIVLGFALATTFIDVTLWVRGVAGKARGLVLGAAPASKAPSSKGDISPAAAESVPGRGRDEVSPTPPNKPIEAIKGFLAGAGNLIGFALKHWQLVIGGLIVIAIFLLATGAVRLPFGDWGKSADTLRAERDAALLEAAVQKTLAERNVELAEVSREVAVLRSEIRSTLQRGRDAIRAAAPENEAPIDPGLVATFRAGLDELCVARADGHRADTCEP